MRKTIRSISLVVSVALVLLVLVANSLPAATPAQPPQPVRVTNIPLPVDVTDSSLATFPGIPPTAFSVIGSLNGTFLHGPDPAGTSYAITAVAFINPLATVAFNNIHGMYGPTIDCDTFTGPTNQSSGPHVTVPAQSTVHLTFPQPFVIQAKPGSQSCLRHTGDTSVTIVGYRIAS